MGTGMKTLLLTALLFVSMAAHANYQNNPQDIHSISTSEADSSARANTASSVDNRISETISSLVMVIPACNEGGGASGDGVSIGLSQRSPSCVYMDGINSAIISAQFFRAQARLCPDDPAEQERLHKKAHAAIDAIPDYLEMQLEGAKDRSKTASISAWFKDTALPFIASLGIIKLLFL